MTHVAPDGHIRFVGPVIPGLLCLTVLAGACGCGTAQRADRAPDPCRGAGFVAGPERVDGRFAARIPAGCADAVTRSCTVADGRGPITREILAAGVRADCFAFNQYVGSGLAQIPGYESGECFGVARLSAGGAAARRVPGEDRPTFRCDGGPAPRDNGGTRMAVPPPAGPARIDGRAADPWDRPPEAGSVGDREAHTPPWAVLVWRDRARRTCVEPGQVIGARTPGRSDAVPGIRSTGERVLATLVGSLRYDSRSGTGIQLYGIGRFQPYDRSVGGTCGDPAAGPGLIVGWESRIARRDQGLATTAVFGVAGPAVASVRVAGRRLRTRPGHGFVHALRGVRDPADAPVVVFYRDGRERRLRRPRLRPARPPRPGTRR